MRMPGVYKNRLHGVGGHSRNNMMDRYGQVSAITIIMTWVVHKPKHDSNRRIVNICKV